MPPKCHDLYPAEFWIKRLDATITALDLTADVFDAAIASRPDVLEKLAEEAVKEKQ